MDMCFLCEVGIESLNKNSIDFILQSLNSKITFIDILKATEILGVSRR
jgi:hypothetical protein